MARARQTRKLVRVRSEEAEWIGANRGWLEANHAGKWIAVKGSKLVAIGNSLDEVLDESEASGIDHPLVTGVPAKEFQHVIRIRHNLNS